MLILESFQEIVLIDRGINLAQKIGQVHTSMAIVTREGHPVFVAIEVASGLYFVLLRVTAEWTSKLENIIVLLPELFQLTRNE
jgi:hypothetical protein